MLDGFLEAFTAVLHWLSSHSAWLKRQLGFNIKLFINENSCLLLDAWKQLNETDTYETRLIGNEANLLHLMYLSHLFGKSIYCFLPVLCCQCEGQTGWNLNFEFLLTSVSRGLVACLNEKVWKEETGQKRARGFQWGCNLRQRKTYIHGNVPGHVDVGFVFVHPHLSGSQGIALGVVIYVIVVGFFGALDMGHSGAREDFHAPTTLPHLHSRKKEFRSTATQLPPNVEANQTTGIEV